MIKSKKKANVELLDERLERAWKNELNVMLIGPHGVSKTMRVLQLAKKENFVLQYFSCSTLDPFVDLVGVPTPRKYCTKDQVWFATEQHSCPVCKSELYGENSPVVESLRMVRPVAIDDAMLVFFDEFNRADPKITNAVMEIIQFGSINGQKLPNLKACWAAINPPNHDANYSVEELDPAVMDRFDLFFTLEPEASVAYLTKAFEPRLGKNAEHFSEALVTWWKEHHNGKFDYQENYISPRRLEKFGDVFLKMGQVQYAVPATGVKGVDFIKLQQMLVPAAKGEEYNKDVLKGMGVTRLSPEEFIKEINSTDDITPTYVRNNAINVKDLISWTANKWDASEALNKDQGIALNKVLSGITATNKDKIIPDFGDVLSTGTDESVMIIGGMISRSLTKDRADWIKSDIENNASAYPKLKEIWVDKGHIFGGKE